MWFGWHLQRFWGSKCRDLGADMNQLGQARRKFRTTGFWSKTGKKDEREPRVGKKATMEDMDKWGMTK